jgi:hypothetical protein
MGRAAFCVLESAWLAFALLRLWPAFVASVDSRGDLGAQLHDPVGQLIQVAIKFEQFLLLHVVKFGWLGASSQELTPAAPLEKLG